MAITLLLQLHYIVFQRINIKKKYSLYSTEEHFEKFHFEKVSFRKIFNK